MAAKKKKAVRRAATTAKKARKKTTKKGAPTPSIRRSRPFTGLDNLTVTSIDTTARNVHGRIMRLGKPVMKFPVRALSNVRYDRRVGHFQL